MIIEFTGAPCCGKSTVSHKLAELLRMNGFSVEEPLYKISHLETKMKRVIIKLMRAVLYAIAHPKVAISAYHYGSLKWCINYLYIRSISGRKKICILDQGLCQCIASLFENKFVNGDTVEECFSTLLPITLDRFQVFIMANSYNIMEKAAKRTDTLYYTACENEAEAIENAVRTNLMLFEKWKNIYGSQTCVNISNNKNDDGSSAAEFLYSEIRLRGIL